jgi:lipid-binding SYLF domain-containing protein
MLDINSECEMKLTALRIRHTVRLFPLDNLPKFTQGLIMKNLKFTPILLIFAALMLTACGSDQQDEAATAPAAGPASEPAAKPAAPAAAEPVDADDSSDSDDSDDSDDSGAAENQEEPGDDKFAAAIADFRASETVGPFFDNSYGYAVFPTIGKGGLIIGGAYGKGRVYVNDVMTGTSSLTQASIGLQAGGQAFTQVIFFETQAAYDDFTRGNFEFDAKAEAIAITAGASAQTSTVGNTAGAGTGEAGAGSQAGAEYKKGMAIFTYAKGGLMAGAAIGGQKFKFEAAE